MVAAQSWGRIGVLMAAAGLIAGCMPGGATDRIKIVEPAATAIPSGTADPRALAAVSTYKEFLKTTTNMLRHPMLSPSGNYPDDRNFAKYSVDPVQSQYESFVATLVRSHHVFRGAAPKSAITVTAIDLKADPNPVVTLADCQTERDSWRAYNIRTNAMNPEMTPAIPAPYGLRVTVIYVQQRWNVQTIAADPAGTCPG